MKNLVQLERLKSQPWLAVQDKIMEQLVVDKGLVARVEEALEQVRPYLKSDGGDISLVGISEDGIVSVQLLGACTHCTVNQMTLKAGVESAIKKMAPEITSVVSVES